jgi:hypothetical protein
MNIRFLKAGAVLALPLASNSSSLADDPIGVLQEESGQQPKYPGPGPLPEYTDSGPCYPLMSPRRACQRITVRSNDVGQSSERGSPKGC